MMTEPAAYHLAHAPASRFLSPLRQDDAETSHCKLAGYYHCNLNYLGNYAHKRRVAGRNLRYGLSPYRKGMVLPKGNFSPKFRCGKLPLDMRPA